MRSCESAVDCLCPRNSISNVVASVMIHDDIKKNKMEEMFAKNMKPLWKVMNIYTYTYTYIYTYSYTYTYTYTSTYAYTHVHLRLRVRVRGGRGEGGEESGVGWVGGSVGW